ncbi:MAG: hypothetical protein KME06_17975 [Kastovskya adunca ATA6-11-RM4]|jgi:hypothetical protein|nr:hypothetical protein [Kastovskya adunca ATA6-11-RM4]
MNPNLLSQKQKIFQDLVNTTVVSIRRHIFVSDMDLDNFEQMADGAIEIKFNSSKVICFVAITEANSVGVIERNLPIPGSSYIILKLTNNDFWQEKINQKIEKIEVLKSQYASNDNPSEFAVEFQLKNGKCFCIEYLDEKEFPDTIRVIEKYEGGQCIRLKFC